MDFSLETILLIAVAFAIGAVLGMVLRRRTHRRQVSPLANTILLPMDETDAPPSAMATPVAPELESQAPVEPPPAPTALRRSHVAPGTAAHSGHQPPALEAPRGEADDLKRLKGIGPQNERRLNGFGIFHFAQIAAWSPEEAQWIGAALGFPGRVEREDWVGQARMLAGTEAHDAPPPDDVPLFPELSAPPAPPRPRRKR